MNGIKKLIFSLISVFSLVHMIACNPVFDCYVGNYPDLFTVAINSVLSSKGFLSANGSFQPVLEKIDEDEYGRILFCYTESYHRSFGEFCLLIQQKKEDNYTYFYPFLNLVSGEKAEGNSISLFKNRTVILDKYNGVTTEQIENLKYLNDWNREINIEKCVKKEIINKKAKGPLEYKQLQELCESLVLDTGNSGTIRHVEFFTESTNDRLIYVLYGRQTDTYVEMDVWILFFDKNGNYDRNKDNRKLGNNFSYQFLIEELTNS